MSSGSITCVQQSRSAPIWTAEAARTRVLEEHAILRELIAELLDLSTHVGSDADVESLQLGLRALLLTLGEHLRFEEWVLVPVLARIEPWGPTRVERLLEEHEVQRSMIRDFFGRIPALSRSELVTLGRGFAEELLRDMAEEEQDLLSPQILHDAPVVAAG